MKYRCIRGIGGKPCGDTFLCWACYQELPPGERMLTVEEFLERKDRRKAPEIKPRPPQSGFACRYFGQETGERRECPTCPANKGRVKVWDKVFDCHHELHTTTTLPGCASCRHHEPFWS